jgi:hypothetical protein
MKATVAGVGAGVLVLALLFGVMVGGGPNVVQAAPQAGPTPVSVTRPAGGDVQVFEIWNAEPLTADTTECVDIGAASVIDAQYQIDQGTTNTVTLTSQWSINGSLVTDGVDFVATNAADASDMVQVQAFGRYICPKADVTNSNPLTVTLYLVAK